MAGLGTEVAGTHCRRMSSIQNMLAPAASTKPPQSTQRKYEGRRGSAMSALRLGTLPRNRPVAWRAPRTSGALRRSRSLSILLMTLTL